MAKYWYCPFTGRFGDEVLTRDRNVYRKYTTNGVRRGANIVVITPDYSYRRHHKGKGVKHGVEPMQVVNPGDTLYFSAHGIGDDGGSVAGKRSGSNQLTADDVAEILRMEGLRDGDAGIPIRIKCIVCTGGGPVFPTRTQLQDPTCGIGYFAHQLAVALGQTGPLHGEANYQHILVGGKPGAHLSNTSTHSRQIIVDNELEDDDDVDVLQFGWGNEVTRKTRFVRTNWFDCTGANV